MNAMPTSTKSEKGNPNRCGSQSEADLLAAAKGGCSTSFDLLCAPHATRLLKTAFKVTKNPEDAEVVRRRFGPLSARWSEEPSRILLRVTGK